MRQHIAYAVSSGHLAEAVCKSEKCYVYGRAVAWAQAKWPGRYSDLHAIRDSITGERERIASKPCRPSQWFPSSDDATGVPIRVGPSKAAISALEEQLTVAHADAERLRSDADAWHRQVEANTLNAKQRRPRL
jgi:hypothetical protein